MASNRYIFSFDDDGTLARLGAKVDKFVAQMASLRGRGADITPLTGFEEQINRVDLEIKELIRQINVLESARQRYRDTQRRGESTRGFRDPIAAEAGRTAFTGEAALTRDIEERKARIVALATQQLGLESQVSQALERQAQIEERIAASGNNLLQQAEALAARVSGFAAGGDARQAAVAERINNLEQRRIEILRQLEEIRARIRRGTGGSGADLLKQEANLARQLEALEARRLAIRNRLVKAIQEAREAELGEVSLARAAAGVSATPEEDAAFTDRQRAAYQEILRLQTQSSNVAQLISQTEGERADKVERIARLEQSGGAALGTSDLLNQLNEVNQALARVQTNDIEELNQLLGVDVQGTVGNLLAEFQRLSQTDLTDPNQAAKMQDLTRRMREFLRTTREIGTKGIPVRLDTEQFFSQLNLLQQTVLGAFDGLARRFRATLQFAISGALIFQVQRLFREFLSAAIEVERTFADIATSLTFDLSPQGIERGSAEFDRVLETIRGRVLQISDELNVLPSDVNEVAFRMVSRFQDVEAALAATEAQMLATRVATINQEEALRALTGIAEVYSIQFADMADKTERQRKQAELYTKILDKATAIQQNFNVPVEDTLEGAVQLAENFRLLGFSIDETLSFVATAVLRTGQTGQGIADRLARSIGQIAEPQTRENLLSLAVAFDQLELTEADFKSGRDALIKILKQADQLGDALQGRVASAIGGRRETAFVSALLGDANAIQEVLEVLGDPSTVGAAERRVAILLQTTQGSIEGIKSAFFELSNQVQNLGLLKPISLFLQALDGILRLVNNILGGINDLIDKLNFIRLPGGFDRGLGDALKTVIAISLAAATLKNIFAAISLATFVTGGSKITTFLKGLVGLGGSAAATGGQLALPGVGGAAEAAVGAAVVGGIFKKVGAHLKSFGKDFVNFLINPLGGLTFVLPKLRTAINALHIALITTVWSTKQAITAEKALEFVRAFSLRGASVAGVGAAFSRIFAVMGRGLAVLGRWHVLLTTILFGIPALIEATRVLFDIPSAIGGGEGRTVTKELEQWVAERAQELYEAGEVASLAEGKVVAFGEAVTDFTDRFRDAQGSFSETAADFFTSALWFTGLDADEIGGTRANNIRSASEAMRGAIEANLEYMAAEIAALIIKFDRTGKDASKLRPAIDQLAALKAALDGIENEIEAAGDETTQRRIYGELQNMLENLPNIPDFVKEAIEAVEGTFREVGSLADLETRMQRIQTNISIGRLTPRQAQDEIDRLREDFNELRRQAVATENEELITEIDDQLLQLVKLERSELERAANRRRQSFDLITDEIARSKAIIDDMKRTIAQGMISGVFGIDDWIAAWIEIAKAQKQLAEQERAEAQDVLRLIAETSPSVDRQIEALRQLSAALQEQIAIERAEAERLGHEYEVRAAQQREIISVQEDLRRRELERKQVQNQNAVRRRQSVLDNTRAIQETIASLRTELAFLVGTGADAREREAVELQIRDEITNLRLAEADRRAAFYRLTAGVGDELMSARAELKASRVRLRTIIQRGGEDTKVAFEAQLEVLQAQFKVNQTIARLADLQLRLASDLTDPVEQALLDVQAAQIALLNANGELEQAQAQIGLIEAQNSAQQAFYSRQLEDLDFLFQTEKINQQQYIGALRTLQGGVNRTTRQGEEIWRDIELLILNMEKATQDVEKGMQFNIPTEIRLPTLFEIRRALAADALGVDYQDNRQQNIQIFVRDDIDVDRVVAALEDRFGANVDIDAARLTAGGAGITIGGFG